MLSEEEITELWRHDMPAYVTLRDRKERAAYLLSKRKIQMSELTIYDLILLGHLVRIGKIKDIDIL